MGVGLRRAGGEIEVLFQVNRPQRLANLFPICVCFFSPGYEIEKRCILRG